MGGALELKPPAPPTPPPNHSQNQNQGRGVMLHKSVLTRGDAARFAAAIHSVITTPSYKQAARLASERLRAAPIPYRQQAADWVLYAAALRNHSSFLHTQGQAMAWWQVACLDVVGAALVVLAVPLSFLYGVWAAGRGGRRESNNGNNLVSVQLMFPPNAQQAAKQLAQQQKEDGEGGAAQQQQQQQQRKSSGPGRSVTPSPSGTPRFAFSSCSGGGSPFHGAAGAAAAAEAVAGGGASSRQSKKGL